MLEFRPAAIKDLEALVAIEKLAGFNHWSRNQLADSLERHRVLLAETGQKVVAFAIFSTVMDEVELLNIVVHPEVQGKGIARDLMEYSLQILLHQHYAKCLLEVAVSNHRAIRLYKNLSFREISQRKNYYTINGVKEDALIMQLDFTGHIARRDKHE